MKKVILSTVAFLQICAMAAPAQPNTTSAASGHPKALFAYLRIRPGYQETFQRLSQDVIKFSRQEPGNLVYIMNHSDKDPQLYVIYELFRSEEDLQAHRAAAYVKSYLKDIADILAPNGFTLEEFDPQVDTLAK